MTDFGFSELILIAVMVLLFVGPEELPEVTRYLGKLYGQVQRMAAELRRSLVLEADRMDEEKRLRDLIKRRKEAEAARRAKEAQEVEGPRAQPQPEAEPEEAPAAEEDELPPGFTAEQWSELPDHIKEIVRRRRSA